MGNHSVGKAFHAAFNAINKHIDTMPLKDLTEFMDAIGNEYSETDAEFDDYCDPEYPLGRAIIRVFNPNLPVRPIDKEGIDEWSDLWYDTVYRKFRERYKFC